MNRILFAIAAFTLTVLMCSCHKNDGNKLVEDDNGSIAKGNNPAFICNDSLPPTDSLANLIGTFLYDDINSVYEVRVVQDGTIDTQDLYVLCTPPDKLPELGKKVVFSGYTCPAAIVSGLAGTTYYQINLTSFHEE